MPQAQTTSTPPAAAGKETPKKEKAPSSVTRTNFKELYPEDAKVTLLVKENPKKKGSKSRERFEGYTGAKTVADALLSGITYQDIVYDVGHGFIKVG